MGTASAPSVPCDRKVSVARISASMSPLMHLYGMEKRIELYELL
jgi:hypothetical protein